MEIIEKHIVPKILFIISINLLIFIILTGCSSVSVTNIPAASAPSSPISTISSGGNTQQIWQTLQAAPVSRLQNMETSQSNENNRAWIQLALLSKQNQSTAALVSALQDWRYRYPNHPGNHLFPDDNTLNELLSRPLPRHIAILLPERGEFSASGHKVRAGILNAYYKHFPQMKNQIVQFYETSQSKNLANLYQEAIAKGADFVIGPLLKTDVEKLRQSTSFTVPTLALNYSNSSFFSLPANFYEYGLLPEDEIEQMAKQARDAGLSKAIVIAPANEWGNRLNAAFSAKWQAMGGSIQDNWRYTNASRFNEDIARLLHIDIHADKKLMQDNNDKTVLEQQRRQDFDVIFLIAQSREARLIVPLLRYYYASHIPIYAVSTVGSNEINAATEVDLRGVIVCDIPGKNQSNQLNKLEAVGQDAYLLSLKLQQLIVLPYFPVYGATGALTLSKDHQIHRRLPCYSIR
jgi:outer membrane PBP1 activator LpoA protein